MVEVRDSSFTGVVESPSPNTDGESFSYMEQSLFIKPESFDDEGLGEAINNSHDPDIVYIAGDISEDVQFSEN